MVSTPGAGLIRGRTSKQRPNMEKAAACQKTGQIAYKKGDLPGAIESFTQVRSTLLLYLKIILTVLFPFPGIS